MRAWAARAGTARTTSSWTASTIFQLLHRYTTKRHPRLNFSVPPGDTGAAAAPAIPAIAAGSMPIACRAFVEYGAGASPLGVHFASKPAAHVSTASSSTTTRSRILISLHGDHQIAIPHTFVFAFLRHTPPRHTHMSVLVVALVAQPANHVL